MPVVNACPTAEVLRKALSGSLAADECDAVASHLEACRTCAARAAEVDTAADLRDESSVPAPPPSVLDRLRGLYAHPDPPPDDRLPDVLGYAFERVLGRGGMGVVYLARHLALGRRVAVKMVREDARAAADHVARFKAEAEALARVQHPNIVQIHDVGESAGSPFFSMEFVDGEPLARLLSSPLPPGKAAGMVRTVAGAVAAAHRAGVFHRDIKPANVLLAADGEPKVTDFGLSRVTGDAGLTRTGAVVGTPAYMAPELASDPPPPPGPAADVYALGAVLYECLTGRPPFTAPTPVQVLHRVVHDEVLPPSRVQPGVPRDLDAICLKCLEKAPARRYASAAELAADLGRFARGEPTVARPPGVLGRLTKLARRRPAATVSIGVSGVAAATLVVMWTAFTINLKRERDRADGNATTAAAREKDASEQRAVAVENLRQARAAAADYFKLVRDDAELKTRGAEELRLKLLRRTLALQDKLRAANDDPPELLAEKARSLHVLAQLSAEVVSPAEAIKLIDEAVQIAEPLTRVLPGDRLLAMDLCGFYQDLATWLTRTGRGAEVEGVYRRVIDRQSHLAATDPEGPGGNCHFNLARSCINYGVLLRRDGKLADAEAMYGRARAAIEECLRKAACNDHYDTLAMCMNSLSVVYDKTNRPDEALAAALRSVEIRADLVRKVPGYPEYLRGLSASHLNVANYLNRPGRNAVTEADAAYRKSIEAQAELVKLHPTLRQQRTQLVKLHLYRGDFLRSRMNATGAVTEYLAAAEQSRTLASGGSDEWPLLTDWGAAVRWAAQLGGGDETVVLRDLDALIKSVGAYAAKPQQKGAVVLLRQLHEAAATAHIRAGRHAEAQRHRAVADSIPKP